MPVQFYNLAYNMYHAENAQAIQNLFYMQERGGTQVAAAQSQDQGKAEQNMQVQTTSDVENNEIAGEGRGAHSFMLSKEEQEEKKEEKEMPADPTGKGQMLDLII